MVKENRKREVILPLLIVSLMIYGIVAISSAVLGDPGKEGYPLRQVLWDVIAVFFMFAVVNFKKRLLRDIAIGIYLVSLVLLAVVLLEGETIGGSKRWLDLKFASFQPSELAKLSLIVILPVLLEKPSLKRFILSVILSAVPVALIIAEPDLGTSALLVFVWLSVVFSSRLSLRYFLVVILIVFLAVPIFYFFGLKDYQRKRIEAFLNPQKYAKSAAYNVLQSIHAIGSGGFLGKGYMKGTANFLGFVPVDYSDFIVAVIGEEFGFLGIFILIILYSSVLLRMGYILSVVDDDYWRMVVVGVASVFFFHVAENLLMCSGLAPVTGIPLPFVSYGGSSALVFGIMIGLVMKAYAISQIGREVEGWIQ